MMCLTDPDHNQSFSNADEFLFLLLGFVRSNRVSSSCITQSLNYINVLIPPAICSHIKGIKISFMKMYLMAQTQHLKTFNNITFTAWSFFPYTQGKNNLLAIRAQMLISASWLYSVIPSLTSTTNCKTPCLIFH